MIECDSSHGDFPQAKKDYKKLANELINIERENKLTVDSLYELLRRAFYQKEIHSDGISKLFVKKEQQDLIAEDVIMKTAEKLIEYRDRKEDYYIIEKELKDFIKTKKRSVKQIKDALESAFRDEANFETEKTTLTKMYTMQNTKPYNNKLWFIAKKINQGAKNIISLLDANLPLLDNSFDTLIARFNDTMCEMLPQLEGDKVIQIGTVVMPYGSNECTLNHIITLDTCDPIENTIIESYKTEEEVLMAWRRFIADEYETQILLRAIISLVLITDIWYKGQKNWGLMKNLEI